MSDENHVHTWVLDRTWAVHGRVASREPVQVEISSPHHAPWLEMFKAWCRHGFTRWRHGAGPCDSPAFVCERRPKPYAITGQDGNDTSDR